MPIKDKERWERLKALGAKSEIPTPEGQARMPLRQRQEVQEVRPEETRRRVVRVRDFPHP